MRALSQIIHWSCPETRDPFLHAFRAAAAARYARAQAERRQAECEESKRRLEPLAAGLRTTR